MSWNVYHACFSWFLELLYAYRSARSDVIPTRRTWSDENKASSCMVLKTKSCQNCLILAYGTSKKDCCLRTNYDSTMTVVQNTMSASWQKYSGKSSESRLDDGRFVRDLSVACAIYMLVFIGCQVHRMKVPGCPRWSIRYSLGSGYFAGAGKSSETLFCRYVFSICNFGLFFP